MSYLNCGERDVEGITHMTSSVSTTFTRAFTQDELEPIVKVALIRMRHLIPSFAVTAEKLPTYDYRLSYRVPEGLSDVERWASQILFFEEGSGSFTANHQRVTGDRWWKACDGVYTHEVHIASTAAPASPSSTWTIV